jgi:hypothetical protein
MKQLLHPGLVPELGVINDLASPVCWYLCHVLHLDCNRAASGHVYAQVNIARDAPAQRLRIDFDIPFIEAEFPCQVSAGCIDNYLAPSPADHPITQLRPWLDYGSTYGAG